jgi:hypothetical protein
MSAVIGSSIARDMAPITPSDVADNKFIGFKVKGNAGNVVVVTDKGVTRTIPMAAGEVEPLMISKVLSTGTTATGIWGYVLY